MAVDAARALHIELQQPSIPLAQNGELELKVKLIRHGEDFSDPVGFSRIGCRPGCRKIGAHDSQRSKRGFIQDSR